MTAITAELTSPTISVEPGESAGSDIRVRNDGPERARLRLGVTGPGHPYSYLAPDTVTVEAGAETLARVTFSIPRAPEPAAGLLRFEVTVTPSASAPGAARPVATAPGAVDVQPFGNVSAMLCAPAALDAKDGAARHDLVLTNHGNAPATAALRARADEARLDVRVDPATVTVPGGGDVTASVEVAPAAARLTGGEVDHDFCVVVEPETGQPFEVAGSYRQRPKIAHPVAWAVVAVAVLGLVTGGVVVASGGDTSGPAADPVAARTARPLDPCPARGHVDMFGIRSIEPDEIAKLPDTYTFLRVGADGCTPARFNPCEPVHYVQNAAAAPPFVADNVREAFRRLSRATGIEFVDDGTTDETARPSAFVPERYGSRWAPILIVWEHFPPEQTSGRSQILGNTVIAREGDVVVSARLRLNVDAYSNETTQAPIRPGFGPPTGSGTGPILRENITWGRIVLHELAHVVGLGHTRDTGSLMYPDAAQHTSRPADFMPPDVEGLRYLGREAGCLTTPPPRPTSD